jgi:hypothetical protein
VKVIGQQAISIGLGDRLDVLNVQGQEVAIVLITAEDGRMVDATVPDVIDGVVV